MRPRTANLGPTEIVLLEEAGYSVHSESQMSLGMVALTAARTVCLATASGSAGPGRSAAARPGRNDPCPCGSGRKYKRCCLDHAGADQPPVSPRPPRAVSADMIPCIGDNAGVDRETRHLASLLREEPGLASLRFVPETVSRLMARDYQALSAAKEADRQYRLDLLSTECGRLPENRPVMRRAADLVLELATKGGLTPGKVRSLAFLLVLAGMEASTPKGEACILASLVFRRSLAEIIYEPDPVEDLVE